jgi:hypothetical protein
MWITLVVEPEGSTQLISRSATLSHFQSLPNVILYFSVIHFNTLSILLLTSKCPVIITVAMGWDYDSVELGLLRTLCLSHRWFMIEYGAIMVWYFQRKVKDSERTGPIPTFATTNPTWIDLGTNLGLRCKKPTQWSPYAACLVSPILATFAIQITT